MHEIVVLSGKGGAGKTSVTAALARAMSAREKIVVCDYDVDAPDLHILLKPETEMRADFVSGHLAVFNSDNCIDCTQCLAFCRFDAIKQAAPYEYPVIEQLCEGCAVCVKLCPELAFDFVPRHCGEYYRSRTRFGTMIHAELTPGPKTPAASSCFSSRRQPRRPRRTAPKSSSRTARPASAAPSSARSRAQASSARSSRRAPRASPTSSDLPNLHAASGCR